MLFLCIVLDDIFIDRKKKNLQKSTVPNHHASSVAFGWTHQQVVEVQERWTVNRRVHVPWRRLDADHYCLGVHVGQAVQTDRERKEQSGRLIAKPCSPRPSKLARSFPAAEQSGEWNGASYSIPLLSSHYWVKRGDVTFKNDNVQRGQPTSPYRRQELNVCAHFGQF